MKIRTDFVSNSSSCSFVIEKQDMMNCFKVISLFKDIEVPYDVADSIYVYLVTVGPENYNAVLEILNETIPEYVERNNWKPFEPGHEDKYFSEEFYLRLSWFIEAFNGNRGNELCNLIDHISFNSSDDFGNEMVYLSLFHTFFTNNGCNPNTENSERDFIHDDSVKFFTTLFKKTNG